jgi:transposase
MTDAVEKGLRTSPNSDSGESAVHGFGGGDDWAARRAMEFVLSISARRVPKDHLLSRIDKFVKTALADIHEQLEPYYSEIGRPSVDPELMIRMLIVGYRYGLRSERRLTQEVELHLAYRWFCGLDLDDRVPHHSTFSENRLRRFIESHVFRYIFERVFRARETGRGRRGRHVPIGSR